MHSLQYTKKLAWNDVLEEEKIMEWRNIVEQYNSSHPIELDRSFGNRDDEYKLVACTDSSGYMYGAVIYLYNYKTKKYHFVLAKNRIINNCNAIKSVPSLELMGILLGVNTLIDLKDELSGEKCVKPVKICKLELFSDSYVALKWVLNYNIDPSKQKHSVFVGNRLF